MGRWRPPPPKSSPYITAEGFAALQKELTSLWDRRSGVTRALAAAAAEGDRSENAEYIYRKKELREIDRRIRYLQKRLPSLKVVSEAPADLDRIFFGAVVTLENESGEEVTYRIVGPDEISGAGRISVDSPLARALLRKTFDEEIIVRTGQGEKRYLIVDFNYL
ncbi:MAG: transcription elongation factor GreB [Gammaproteobacteria bacterium]